MRVLFPRSLFFALAVVSIAVFCWRKPSKTELTEVPLDSAPPSAFVP